MHKFVVEKNQSPIVAKVTCNFNFLIVKKQHPVNNLKSPFCLAISYEFFIYIYFHLLLKYSLIFVIRYIYSNILNEN